MASRSGAIDPSTVTTLARTLTDLPLDHPGRPLRIARGIWTADPDPDLVHRCHRIMAALPTHCVVVGWTAARLHCLWLPPDPKDLPVEIAFTATGPPSRHTRSRRPEIRSSRRLIDPRDRALIGRVAVVSAAYAWRDLAMRLPLPALVAAGDSVLRGGTTAEEMGEVCARRARRPGARRAESALGMLDVRSRSRPESHMHAELSGPGLPPFQVNVAVFDAHGQWLAEPDLSNEQLMIGVEYQGGGHAGLTRMRRDLSRELDLSGRSWDLVGAGPADVFTHPDRLRAAVRRLATSKGWAGG